MPENVAKEAMQNRTNGDNDKEEMVSYLPRSPLNSNKPVFCLKEKTKV